jgi:hypothetical protein
MTLFLDRGAHIDDQDDRGRTALMIAAELNHAAAVDLLLARGADKTIKDKQGKTASDLTSLTALRDKLAAVPELDRHCHSRESGNRVTPAVVDLLGQGLLDCPVKPGNDPCRMTESYCP